MDNCLGHMTCEGRWACPALLPFTCVAYMVRPHLPGRKLDGVAEADDSHRSMESPVRAGFHRLDVQKTTWDVPLRYSALRAVGSGAYGTVWWVETPGRCTTSLKSDEGSAVDAFSDLVRKNTVQMHLYLFQDPMQCNDLTKNKQKKQTKTGTYIERL